jgi:murein L,D-transpeptidase YafK
MDKRRRHLLKAAGASLGIAGALLGPQREAAAYLPLATRLAVRKADRRLSLYSRDTLLSSYRIALGLNPEGHKEREGDFRTPEGRYYLASRNERSDFFLAIQISYPNKTDLQKARRHGWAPGGSIMIHGMPNVLRHPADFYQQNDWTNGCIALSNSDMIEVWMRTEDYLPIDILP